MTREEFDEWLEERKDALDDMQQSDTTPQKWLSRLYTSLKTLADQEDAAEADPDEDELFEEDDDDDEPVDDDSEDA